MKRRLDKGLAVKRAIHLYHFCEETCAHKEAEHSHLAKTGRFLNENKKLDFKCTCIYFYYTLYRLFRFKVGATYYYYISYEFT